MIFHGIKNDLDRDGFECTVPPHSNKLLCLSSALKVYISKLQVDNSNAPLFCSLKDKSKAVSVQTLSNILSDTLKQAGLEGYMPKDFRPTGATIAVDTGENPDAARMVGRWKTFSVFMDHYVHSKPSSSYSDNLLK